MAKRTAQSELSSHFGIHRAPAEAADIEIKIKTRLKWRQMTAKWPTLNSPNDQGPQELWKLD